MKLKTLALSILTLIVTTRTFSAAGQSGRPATNSFTTTVQPFLAKNCYGCHNDRLTSGNLNLTQYKTSAAIAQDRERWERVLQKVRGGEMPPKQLPRPAEPELSAAMKWIEGELDRLDSSAKPDPGRVTARRLNRAEYNNTVKDLLGVDFRPADDFPQDDSGYGFDNNGDVLSLSVVQVEKYLTAAETVARTAIFGPQVTKPTMARY